MIQYSDKYTKFFNESSLMGPNSLCLLDELLEKYPIHLERDNTILDLGCGTGLSSLFLANEVGATVYANDLWIKAEDNLKRFTEWGEESDLLRSCSRWKQIIGKSNEMASVDIWEMENFDLAWDSWLSVNNEYAIGDKAHYDSVIRKYTNFVGIIVKKK